MAGDSIALVQPVQQVAVPAALRAERPVRRIGRLAAERAGISFGRFWTCPADMARPGLGSKTASPPVRRASSASQAGLAFSCRMTRGAAWSATLPCSRPARRSKARAAAAPGSARRISGMRGPDPAADDLQEAEAVHRRPLERLGKDGVDRRRARPAVCRAARWAGRCRSSRRCRSAGSPAPPPRRRPRRAPPGGGCRPRRTGSWPGVRLMRSAPPAKAISPVAASSSSSDQPAASNRSAAVRRRRPAGPLGEARARAERQVGRAQPGRLGPAGLGDRPRATISARKAAPSLTCGAARPPPRRRPPAVAMPAMLTSFASTTAPARRPGQLDLRLEDARRPRPGSRDSRRSLPRRATQPSG